MSFESEGTMNEQTWKHYKLSKHIYPTEVKCNGLKGTLYIGRVKAKEALEKMLGRSVDDSFRVSDTFSQWVFSEPLENFKKLRNAKKHKAKQNA